MKVSQAGLDLIIGLLAWTYISSCDTQAAVSKKINQIVLDQAQRRNLEARYWPKVSKGDIDDCWLWTAKAKHPFGYGRMTAGRGVNLKAHQVAWALENGPIPIGGNILHSCDNPPCCNPNHLFIGSNADNTQDMRRKGRGVDPPIRRGEAHHAVTIPDRELPLIKQSPKTLYALAKEYGVSTMTIWRIKKNRTRMAS